MTTKLGIIISLFAFSVSVSADLVPAKRTPVTMQFSLDSTFEPGSTVYYNCDSVEHSLGEMLSDLGASDISVRCSGGIDHSGYWDAYIDAQFSPVRSTLATDDEAGTVMAEWRPVELSGLDNCFLAVQLFDQVRDSFELASVEAPNRCSRIGGRYRIRLMTLFAQAGSFR